MANNNMATQFKKAIVRIPSKSVTGGLRAVDCGAPDVAALGREHQSYIGALEAAGVAVTILSPLEDYPDSIFVEDAALTFSEGAILLRPGAPSRRGEVAPLAPELRKAFETVLDLPPEGFVEGGDVLRTKDQIMIGLSERTDLAGAQGLVKRLDELGYKGVIVETPKDVLHFKTDCSLLDEETVFTTSRLAGSGIFADFKTVLTPDGEEAAANALRVNDVVMAGAGFPRSLELLDRLGYEIVALDTAEIGKIDAGLSCMSLRW